MIQNPSSATCGYTLLQYLSSTHDLLKGSLYLINAHLSVSPSYLPIALTVMHIDIQKNSYSYVYIYMDYRFIPAYIERRYVDWLKISINYNYLIMVHHLRMFNYSVLHENLKLTYNFEKGREIIAILWLYVASLLAWYIICVYVCMCACMCVCDWNCCLCCVLLHHQITSKLRRYQHGWWNWGKGRKGLVQYILWVNPHCYDVAFFPVSHPVTAWWVCALMMQLHTTTQTTCK